MPNFACPLPILALGPAFDTSTSPQSPLTHPEAPRNPPPGSDQMPVRMNNPVCPAASPEFNPTFQPLIGGPGH